MPRVASTLFTALVVGATLVGCGTSGGAQPVPGSAGAVPGSAGAASPSPTTAPRSSRPAPVAAPSSSGFRTDYAVPCAGSPDLGQVLALLRSRKVLATGAAATASSGPLCSGDWQYTALDVAGAGPLQVITRGRPGALELITAGTDVCTPDVQSGAPPGIRAVARC
jgi:hypothetical protein